MTTDDTSEWKDEFDTHVAIINPVLDDFCQRRGYAWDRPGRYPARDLRWYKGDLMLGMSFTLIQKGEHERYARFYQNIPVQIGTGGMVNAGAGTYILRGPYDLTHMPFAELVARLPALLEEVHAAIADWTRDDVIQRGRYYGPDWRPLPEDHGEWPPPVGE